MMEEKSSSEWILNWYDNLEPDVKLELTRLTMLFHPDPSMKGTVDGNLVVKKFRDYLLAKVDDVEAVKRVINIVGLIDLVIDSRSTKEDWDSLMDRNLFMRSREKEDGMATSITDQFFANFEQDSKAWIDSAKKWQVLKQTELRGKRLFQWWSDQFIKKTHK